jgi:hypothetical protein
MSERSDLILSIVETIKEYRQGEIPQPDYRHVDRWINQFDHTVQLPFLREFAYVIDKSFITRDGIIDFLDGLVSNVELAGDSPSDYWSSVNFLNIQKDGVSQLEMLKLFDKSLRKNLDLKIETCGNVSGDYLYLDDIMFSGNRAASDLEAWIANVAPQKANLQVVMAVMYSSARDYLRRVRLNNAIKSSGKKIEIQYWCALEIENQKTNRNNSGVYWPTVLPAQPEMTAYNAIQKFPFVPRNPGGKYDFFSTENGRQVLENELLIAGLKIRSQHSDPKPALKPLGFGGFGVGFGATLATYRNCPNNAPLAIWWGEGATSGPFQWYPLLPRKTYSSPENVFKQIFE